MAFILTECITYLCVIIRLAMSLKQIVSKRTGTSVPIPHALCDVTLLSYHQSRSLLLPYPTFHLLWSLGQANGAAAEVVGAQWLTDPRTLENPATSILILSELCFCSQMTWLSMKNIPLNQQHQQNLPGTSKRLIFDSYIRIKRKQNAMRAVSM